MPRPRATHVLPLQRIASSPVTRCDNIARSEQLRCKNGCGQLPSLEKPLLGLNPMVITGSALLIKPGSDEKVLERLKDFPEVTFHVKSASGLELVVNLEAEDTEVLEQLCKHLRESIPEIVDIAHVYVNFEEEIEKIEAGKVDKTKLRKPKFVM